ncbi:MAG: hypothetical protein VST68_05805, partial [Nitrospirota bacterium]|nr:hypothetical protein [Nitrospirota bacterium]
MSDDHTSVAAILPRTGVLTLKGNLRFATEFKTENVTMRNQPSGHLVFYRADGRRILMTDPDGNPLHECE